MKNNILYFEGAGWSGADTSKKTIGNCRVRTAFTNLEGRKIYLELTAGRNNINDKYFLCVDNVFYITDDPKVDDCNVNRIKTDRGSYEYSVKGITKWVNSNLNCNFDKIEVLPDLSGYAVHGDNRSYNMIENFVYNKDFVEKRERVKKHIYKLEKSEGKKFPNFSLWVDKNDSKILHLLRHFEGYNKSWTIDITKANCIVEAEGIEFELIEKE